MPILILSTLLCISALAILTWLHNQHHLDILAEPCPPPGDDAPLISVIVPARNEERNIGECVAGLLDQTYPHYEVIVVDDRSTDATLEILVSIRSATRPADKLKIIHGVDLPPGWAGKPHALTQGAEAARGEWLLFVDADTFLTPEALSAAHAKAVQTGADLFTVLTRQVMLSFWERTLLPLVMTALSTGFSPRKVNDPDRKEAIANGQFIFIKRSVYDATGGHAAIKGSIVEDKDLAVLVKGRGYRLVLADGQQIAATRMYTSLPEMWEGWTKNIYLGLKDNIGLVVLGVFGAFLAVITALGLPLWLGAGIAWLTVAGPSSGALGVVVEAALVWGYLIFWRVTASRAMGVPGWYALTTPLGAAVFAAMMLASAWNVLSGRGVTWKGRTYVR
ncbi:MAG: glycosyltransferase family 2 protein [Chloroflexota bacterium]